MGLLLLNFYTSEYKVKSDVVVVYRALSSRLQRGPINRVSSADFSA